VTKLSKLNTSNQNYSGFTLVELLVAIAITGIVIGASGFGLVSILQANKRAEAATERRTELNRALDFISEEVRMASYIEPSVSDSFNASTTAPKFSETKSCNNSSDGLDCVLILKIPNIGGANNESIVYYVAPAASPWIGPRVIYRWGPPFDANGNYTHANDVTGWQHRPLIDSIEGDLGGSAYADCPSGWSPNLDTEDRDSLYACVDPTGRVAQVYLLGQLRDALGNLSGHYAVSSRVFARSSP